MVRISVLLLSAIVFGSCQRDQKSFDTETFYVDLETSDTISLIEFVSAVELIPLDNNIVLNNNLPRKVVLKNGKYYVLPRNDVRIYIFNLNGSFVKTIGKRGKGPGELLRVEDFRVNNNSISLLEPSGKIITYHIDNGQKIETLRLPEELMAVNHFLNLKNNNLMLYTVSHMNFHLSYYSKELDKILKKELKNIDPDSRSFLSSLEPFQELEFEQKIYDYTENSIYEIIGDSLSKKYRFDFGPAGSIDIHDIPKSNNSLESFHRYLENHNKIFVGKYLDFDSFTLFSVMYKGFERTLVYLKSEHKAGYLPFTRSQHSPREFTYFAGVDYNWIGCAVTKEMILHNVPVELIPSKSLNRLKELSNDHNPILFRFKLK